MRTADFHIIIRDHNISVEHVNVFCD